MKISKTIEYGEYKFQVTIKSKSVHAHSLMSDYKNEIEQMRFASPLSDMSLEDFIPLHMANKK